MGSVVILQKMPWAVTVPWRKVLREYTEEIKIDEVVMGGKISLLDDSHAEYRSLTE